MTPETLHYENLLQPVSREAPAGSSLRHDPLYDRIKAARRQERALSQGDWERPLQQANWGLVEELCRTALATRAKDLQLAVWLTEAWLHLFGLPGFSSGLHLIKDLHNEYLLDMLPAPESISGDGPVELPLPTSDSGVEHRLNILQRLNEDLALQLKLLPLSQPSELSGLAAVSLADVEAAHHRAQALRHQGAPSEPGPADGGLSRSLHASPAEFLAQTGSDIARAREAVTLTGAALDRYYEDASVLKLSEVLTMMAQSIAPALPRTLPAAPVPANAEPTQGASDDDPGFAAEAVQPHDVLSDACASREQAYATLEQIADFLAQLEPHSPVPYLLRRAISWGGMSLPELLPELLKDQAAVQEIGHLLRIEKA